MNEIGYPHYSKYRSETVAMERSALILAEHEVNQERGRYITKDDILNLRIDLGTCKDVNDFIGV